MGFGFGSAARIFHPEGIAGMVIVDHAFLPANKAKGAHQASAPASPHCDRAPGLVAQASLVFGFEDDVTEISTPLIPAGRRNAHRANGNRMLDQTI
jgi:hypothetical protein